MLVEFENVFLIGGIFFTIWGIFYNWGHFFLKLGAKNNFGIEKISYFGSYMDPCQAGVHDSGSVIQTNRQTEITTVICIVIFFKEGGGCLFPIITLYIVYIEQI